MLMADLGAEHDRWAGAMRAHLQVTAMRQIRQLMLRKVKGEVYHRLQIWRSHVRFWLLEREMESHGTSKMKGLRLMRQALTRILKGTIAEKVPVANQGHHRDQAY